MRWDPDCERGLPSPTGKEAECDSVASLSSQEGVCIKLLMGRSALGLKPSTAVYRCFEPVALEGPVSPSQSSFQ